ncbi:MAG: saccharopine dehydrogenase NADP-binding domain-containing protein [Firmicutes bacterium]|nr:saccharopine dehydrogenase NADP-binding domain-containing protein [Bacillota bacterium]
MKWMIYGATGYTGELIVHHAKRMGYRPILAGRNKAKIEALANRVDMPWRAFGLDDIDTIASQLEDVDLVVHCAGPFEDTAEPMLQACLRAKTHYLDITGEISVFELAHSLRKEADAAGIIICPGVGFDVIPTDCIAARLNAQMPNATHLTLGFDSSSRMSRGTALTGIRRLHLGGAVRENGDIKNVPLAFKTRRINFGDGEKLAMTIPWGDVATAFYSTGIPNIEVYVPASPNLVKRMQRMNWVRFAFKFSALRRQLEKKVSNAPAGPDQKERAANYTWVWGEARNAAGDVITIRQKVLNGYELTSRGAVELAIYILRNQLSPGYYTPSRLYGAKLIDRFLVD